MKIVVRPIRYTARVPQMQEWASRLGLVTLLQTPDWVVLGAGAGRLALHAVPEGDPLDRVTTLAVETDDLDALERRWADAGMTTRRTDEHDIPLLFATTPFGGEIAAGVLTPSPGDGTDGGDALSVMPMLVTTDVPAAADWFTAWGLRRRISSDGDGWVDLDAPDGGGLVGIHLASNLTQGPPPQAPPPELAVGLTFESSDVDAMLTRVHANGLEDAHVVDESYNRTLMVGCPDGDTIWVGGEQTDLYGYSRA